MRIKTKEEIDLIIQGGQKIGQILSYLSKISVAGATTKDVDKEAERRIIECGGKPAFKGFKNSKYDDPFPTTICACVNEELVHGIARKDAVLRGGDIFSIDIGMEWPSFSASSADTAGKARGGYFTDTAITVPIGTIKKEILELLNVTKEALEVGIKAAQPGRAVSDIGKAIEHYVKSQGTYGIVRDLVGHGVGHAVHEDPRVPNYYDPKLDSVKLVPGMVIAIEPMISLGDWRIKTADDGWTIVMQDGSVCAHFEHTVVITEKGNIVATRRPDEKF